MHYFENDAQKKSLVHIIVGVCVSVLVLLLIFFSQKERLNPEDQSAQSATETTVTETDALQPGSVYGRVSIAVEGAVVIADGKKFVTNKKGEWTFSEVKAGSDITVLAYGYSPYQDSFNPDIPILLDPLPEREISARVYDENGSLIKDVFLMLLDSNTREPRQIVRPDEQGAALFLAPGGDNIIFAIKKGYRLGFDIIHVDTDHVDVSIILKKRTAFGGIVQNNNSATVQKKWKLPFIETVYAQDAGADFEEAYPEEYRLMLERNEHSTGAEGIELSPDDVADELENNPEKKDWNSLGAEKLQFSDDIPEGYRLERKMVDGKEVFVVESDVYTESLMQKMWGLGVDYGELSVEAQAERKIRKQNGGRPQFEVSIFWNRDDMGSKDYIESLYDTINNPVNSSYSIDMREGGMTRPPTLYDKDGHPIRSEDVRREFIEVSKQIHEGNPRFFLLVDGSKDPIAVVGVPFTLEARVELNHESVPGWRILDLAAIGGYFRSRWINNPTEKFRAPGKIMPYLVQNAPARDTQFSDEHVQRQEFTCLELGEETITYTFEVSYRFAPKKEDPRGLIEPGWSKYTYEVPITIRCEGPAVTSQKAPDQCGDPATAIVRGGIGGDHQDILQSVEVYVVEDERGYAGSAFATPSSGSFEASLSLRPGFYYYWVFGHTENGHVYLMREYEGSINIEDKKEDGKKCEEEEEDEDTSEENVPIKKYADPVPCERAADGTCLPDVYWVVPR